MKKWIPYVLILAAVATMIVAGMKRSTQRQAWEYAPNMYLPVGYEPLSQVERNPFNKTGSNMRMPVKGTVPRSVVNHGDNDTTQSILLASELAFRNIGPADLAAAESLTNPIPQTEQSLKEGEALYGRYCQHCHGATGKGDGPVGKVYLGVPVYSSDALKNLSSGHIYHVITYGIRRMWPHGSQVTPEERWKIVQYVHQLQQTP